MIGELQKTTDYEMLSLEEQDQIFYDLMSSDIKII
nr:MAG TPA: hypothetical protein [Caudoviricetes sp.]